MARRTCGSSCLTKSKLAKVLYPPLSPSLLNNFFIIDKTIQWMLFCISPLLPFPTMMRILPSVCPSHPSLPPTPLSPHLIFSFFFLFFFFDRLEGKMNDRYSFTHVPLKNCRNYGCILSFSSFSSFSSFISLLFLIFLSSFVFYFDAQDIVSKYGGGHAHLDAKLIAGASIPKHKE